MSVNSFLGNFKKVLTTVVSTALVAGSLVATSPANATVERVTDNPPTVAAVLLNCDGPSGASVGDSTQFHAYQMGTNATADFTLGTACTTLGMSDTDWQTAGIQSPTFDLFGTDGNLVGTYDASSQGWVTTQWGSNLDIPVSPGQTLRFHGPRTLTSPIQMSPSGMSFWVNGPDDGDPMTQTSAGRLDFTFADGTMSPNYAFNSNGRQNGTMDYTSNQIVYPYTAYTSDTNQGTFSYSLNSCRNNDPLVGALVVDNVVTQSYTGGAHSFDLTGLSAGTYNVKVRVSCMIPTDPNQYVHYEASTPVYIESRTIPVTIQNFVASTPVFGATNFTIGAEAGNSFSIQPNVSAPSIGNVGSNLTFEWFKNNVLIPNETGWYLNVSNSTTADSGIYKVRVTNTMRGATTVATSPDFTVNITAFRRYQAVYDPNPMSPSAPTTNSSLFSDKGTTSYSTSPITVTVHWYSCPSGVTVTAESAAANLNVPVLCTDVSSRATSAGSSGSSLQLNSSDLDKKFFVIHEATHGSDTLFFRSPSTAATVAGSSGGGGGGPSQQVIGFDLQNTLTGGSAAGKAVQSSLTNVANPSPVNAMGDGRGGYFDFVRGNSTTARLNHFIKTGYDSTFGASGASISFPIPTGSTLIPGFGAAGWYGDRSKWFGYIVEGSNSSDSSAVGRVTFKRGTYNSTDPSASTYTGAQFKGICTSAFDSSWDINDPTSGAYLSPVSAATSDPILALACSNSALGKSGLLLVKVTSTGPQLFAKISETSLTASSGSSVDGYGADFAYSSNPRPGATDSAIAIALTNTHGLASAIVGRELVKISLTGTVTRQPAFSYSNTSIDDEVIELVPLNSGPIYGAYHFFHWDQSTQTQTSADRVLSPASSGSNYFTAVTLGMDARPGSLPAAAANGWSSFSFAPNSFAKDGKVTFIRNMGWMDLQTHQMFVAFAPGALTFSSGVAETTGEPAILLGSPTGRYYPLFMDEDEKANFLYLTITNPSGKQIRWNKVVGNGDLSIGGAVAPSNNVPSLTQDANTVLGFSVNSPAAGTTFTLTGTGLTYVTGVSIAGTWLPSAKFVRTATSIVVTVPSGTAGMAAVKVKYGTTGSEIEIPVGTWEYIGANKITQTLSVSGGSEIFNVGDADRILIPVSNYDVSGTPTDTGLTVSVVSKSAGICTVTQNLLHFVAAGTCVIEATQAGNARFAAAQKLTKTFYVEPQYDGASALYSTDNGKPTITLNGTGMTSVTQVKIGDQVISGSAVSSNAAGTVLTVKVPAATSDNAGDSANLVLMFGSPANPTPLDTQDDFTFVGPSKLAQTITFNPATSGTYGDAVVTLAATSAVVSGPLAGALDVVVALKSTTASVCNVTGNSLRFLSSGTCTVVASQAGNVGLLQATNVSRNITVAKKAQTITVASPTVTLTDIDTASVGATLDSEDEMDLEYSSNEDICTVAGDGTITGISAGTCVITIGQSGDARYLAATPVTVTATITSSSATVPDEVVEADGNGVQPAVIANGGANTFTATNDPSFELSWDKAKGLLIPRAKGIYTGFIQAKLTFRKNNVDYVCTVVFGSNAPMKNTKPAEKKAAKAMKVFTAKSAFCADPNGIPATVLQNLTNLDRAKFAKIKPAAKDTKAAATVVGSKKYEAAALPLLKNFVGDVTIEIRRFRAWPTTGVNFTGDKNLLRSGKQISATKRTTTVRLG